MRFLIVSLGIHPDVVGGAWRVAAVQAAGLASRGHDVHVITVQPDPPRANEESRDGFRLHRFPQSKGHFFSNWRSENHWARQILVDLVRRTGHPEPPLLVQHHAYLAPSTQGLPGDPPLLHVFHGPWSEEYRLARTAGPRGPARRLLDVAVTRAMKKVECGALRRARRVITLSRHFAENLRRWHPDSDTPVLTVPGGVDFVRFENRPADGRRQARARYGLAPEDFLFVALRRLDPRMGLDLLVDAFARVVPRHRHARLWLTGRGPAETALREQIHRHGLQNSVRLLGFVPDETVPDLLNAADVALMPSLDLEGFGLATAEALACGTPVLGSRAGATPELLAPLDPALLFSAGSVDALADRLDEVLTSPDRLPSRDRCAEFARARFSWKHQVDACEQAALEWTARHPPPDA